ncbi:AraC family transcriptional regulator [Pullulanibacillus pueri]|uniref:AraC family transcriptional regulator n=1 Tax=Pullulanibacillus pueri TaxID=1437324 RepID=A0A8J2ZU64_9BACL|nr:helix-turn-helix domain-containing protein [Pullulanibacillus pueri]GGH77903.1 AraC family transcriptional regulator [Pullulanibacillus pueri]
MHDYFPLQPPRLQTELNDSHYRYHEYLPSPFLRNIVACYWTVDIQATDTEQLHRIIPDGCVDIIFDLRSHSSGKGAFITGLMPTYEAISRENDCSFFGIRFFLESIPLVLHYPVSSFGDNRVFLQEVWGTAGSLWSEEVLSVNGDIAKMIDHVESKLEQLLAQNILTSERLVEKGIHYMHAYKGNLTITSLASELNYSERHIRRAFKNECGLGPKELLEIFRFQYLLQGLYRFSEPSKGAVWAGGYGYYDQSHLIKNFQRYYGLSPSQVFNQGLSKE